MLLAATVALLFLGAPAGGAFYLSDAPRHALNGVFVKDFLVAAPFNDPTGFAFRYYAQYPSLTILFYPPLFYFLSAPFYLVFGVSHETALLVVFLHYVALAIGCYRLARFWLDPFYACATAFTITVAPEVAFWGRQVMLDIPAFAFLVWSAVFLTRYRRTHSPLQIYVAAALLMLAMYTKITTAFMLPVYFAILFWERRAALFRDKHIHIVSALVAMALLPLFILTVKFGQANVQSVTGILDPTASRASIAGWIWYLRKIPEQIGWTAAALALAGVVRIIARPDCLGMERRDVMFWGMWFLIGYFFFSSINLKEPRFSIFLLLPLLLAAVQFLRMSLPDKGAHLAVFALACIIAAQTVFFRPVLYVKGYSDAVDFVAKAAPRQSVVLFSGYRDGAFVFNMRMHEDRRDLSVLRADKLLLRVSVKRELGVEQKPYNEADISDLINRSGVHYVVAQPGFWDDLEVMRRFESVLKSQQFREVARIPMQANFPAWEKELVIYRNKGQVKSGPIDLKLELPIINQTIQGTVGAPDNSAR